MKRAVFILLIISIWIIQSSFFIKGDLDLPEKKAGKLLGKIWKDKTIDIQKIDIQDLMSMGNYYMLKDNEDTLGYLYVGRINSCRQGGCAIGDIDEELPFEFFDYLVVTNKLAKVEKIKIYNYQATHGHEVMSSGWLRQYKGFKGEKKLRYGKDIEAISGATVSAKALNNDIQEMVSFMKRNLVY